MYYFSTWNRMCEHRLAISCHFQLCLPWYTAFVSYKAGNFHLYKNQETSTDSSIYSCLLEPLASYTIVQGKAIIRSFNQCSIGLADCGGNQYLYMYTVQAEFSDHIDGTEATPDG